MDHRFHEAERARAHPFLTPEQSNVLYPSGTANKAANTALLLRGIIAEGGATTYRVEAASREGRDAGRVLLSGLLHDGIFYWKVFTPDEMEPYRKYLNPATNCPTLCSLITRVEKEIQRRREAKLKPED